MDEISAYVGERCELEPGASIRSTELYLDYERWAHLRGRSAISRTALARALRRHGVWRIHRRDYDYFAGIRLANQKPSEGLPSEKPHG